MSIGGHQRRAPSSRRLTPLPPVKHSFTFTQKPVQTSSPLCSMSAGSSSTSHTHICIHPCTKSHTLIHVHTQPHGEQYINHQPSKYQSLWVTYQVQPEYRLKCIWSERHKGISWTAALACSDCREGPSGLQVTTLTSFSALRSYVPRQLRAEKRKPGDRAAASEQWRSDKQTGRERSLKLKLILNQTAQLMFVQRDGFTFRTG